VNRDRTELFAAGALGDAWTPVPAPGPVRDIVAAGDRLYVVADFLGRLDAAGKWTWIAWPAPLRPEHLSVHGDLVVAWGRLDQSQYYHGGLAISRDGGASIRYAVLEQPPLWAALDPHHPNQLLATIEGRTERELVRLTID
jgi:hypothetical protein